MGVFGSLTVSAPSFTATEHNHAQRIMSRSSPSFPAWYFSRNAGEAIPYFASNAESCSVNDSGVRRVVDAIVPLGRTHVLEYKNATPAEDAPSPEQPSDVRQAIRTAASLWSPSSSTACSRIRNFWILPVTVIGKPSTSFQ